MHGFRPPQIMNRQVSPPADLSPQPTDAAGPTTEPNRPARGLRRWLRRRRGTLLTLLVLLAVVAAVLYVRDWSPVAVKTQRVTRGAIVAEVHGRGTIESDREVQLGFDLVGRLSDVLVDEGSPVSLGQELARLEPEQLAADLGVASKGVESARTALARVAADERRARAVLGAAQREERRISDLAANNVVSTHDLDIAKDAVRISRAELDRVLAQRQEATRAIALAEGGATQREVTVLRATLLAPFDGLITRRLREPGDTLTVGATVLRLVDTESVHVAAWIDETALPRLALGQRAEIRRPGDSAPVPATVSRLGWESDRQTHELLVEVTADAPLGRISIGQRADVSIDTERKDDALLIPTSFVQHDDAGTFCQVDRDGRITRVAIEIGLVGDEAVEVTAGLVEGDTLLMATKPGAALPSGRRWKTP